VARTTDHDGNVYIAGDTRGTMPDNTSVGLQDAFVRKYDRAGNEIWTTQFGTPLNDFAFGVAVDPTGRVYVAGRSDAAYPGQTFAGGLSDAYVASFDADGHVRWVRQFGSDKFENLNAVAADATGSVVVAGGSTGGLPGFTNAGGGLNDSIVRKYDQDGNEQWTRQFGSTLADQVLGVALAPNGDVAIAGSTVGPLPGVPAPVGLSDAYVRLYDRHGNERWTRQFGTADPDQANAVSVAPDGVVAVVGQFRGTDVLVRTYDARGNEIWTDVFGTSGPDSGLAAATDSGGAVFVAGVVGASLDDLPHAGDSDVFVRKYDRRGSELWTLAFGSAQTDTVTGISAGDASDVYVSGLTAGALVPGVVPADNDVFLAHIVTSPH